MRDISKPAPVVVDRNDDKGLKPLACRALSITQLEQKFLDSWAVRRVHPPGRPEIGKAGVMDWEMTKVPTPAPQSSDQSPRSDTALVRTGSACDLLQRRMVIFQCQGPPFRPRIPKPEAYIKVSALIIVGLVEKVVITQHVSCTSR